MTELLKRAVWLHDNVTKFCNKMLPWRILIGYNFRHLTRVSVSRRHVDSAGRFFKDWGVLTMNKNEGRPEFS
jgi:hypothetical protein